MNNRGSLSLQNLLLIFIVSILVTEIYPIINQTYIWKSRLDSYNNLDYIYNNIIESIKINKENKNFSLGANNPIDKILEDTYTTKEFSKNYNLVYNKNSYVIKVNKDIYSDKFYCFSISAKLKGEEDFIDEVKFLLER